MQGGIKVDKILIIYHSGVGNTKMVAKNILQNLSKSIYTEMLSVENLPNDLKLDEYKGLVIGFPTIHTHPTKRILHFVEKSNAIDTRLPIFIYTTYGLYCANTLRIFAKKCISKNLIPVVYNSYRCAATDGTLLLPNMKFLFSHEKKLNHNINNDCNNFINVLEENTIDLRLPRFKLYSILNYPNKIMGQIWTFKIYLDESRCVKCGKCISQCPAQAIELTQKEYPILVKSKCEKCYRCIHHCSYYALSILKKKAPKKLLGES